MLRKVLMAAGIAAAAGCGGGGSSPTENKTSPPSVSAGVVSVQVGDNFFNPQSVRVAPGQTVQWTLVGQMTNHTVTDTGGAFDSGFLDHSGATFSHTFGSADSGRTFNYQCQTHAALGMKGVVQVE